MKVIVEFSVFNDYQAVQLIEELNEIIYEKSIQLESAFPADASDIVCTIKEDSET